MRFFWGFVNTVWNAAFLQYYNASKPKRCAREQYSAAAIKKSHFAKNTMRRRILKCPFFPYRWKEHEVTNIAHPILEPKDVLRLPLGDALGPIGLLIKCAAI